MSKKLTTTDVIAGTLAFLILSGASYLLSVAACAVLQWGLWQCGWHDPAAINTWAAGLVLWVGSRVIRTFFNFKVEGSK